MKPYVNLLIWLAIGCVLGYALYLVLTPQSHVQGTVKTVPYNQTTNQTMPNSNQTNEKQSVNITVIEAPDCDDCNAAGVFLLQTQLIVNQSKTIKAGNSRAINYSSPDAAMLISKYNITELPTIIIEGPVYLDPELITVWTNETGIYTGGALVTRMRYPPFYDIQNRTIIGLAKVIGIRAVNCPQCEDPSMLISSLESYQIGMSFSNKTVYLENSTEAQALIARYNITKLPTLLLSASDTELYPIYTQLKKLSDVRDNWLILRDILPPYVDLSANHTVRGLVHVVFLINSSCTACFNATGLSDYISQSSGLAVINRTTYEINSTAGQALLAKYNITKIPTLIYSPEAKHYSNFERIWKNQSSTVESDGWFVFRAHHLLGSVVYQNISR